jgi:dienelactone hydrolase/tRNA A-37 threonylcarbamoyl transferase component Bud32
MTASLGPLTAALGDRYRIERELGQGGMATVYLAHDLKHDRDVAIKVLHSDLARSITGERFLREIAITARLNHPHILALLDSGATADGELLYYVMPVATGESLRDHLSHRGPLPIAEALRVAMDATEALVHAHGQGVVHRDIKPANILLSGGHAIVVDFGIAKAVGQARETDTLTSAGMSLGTPASMAPEQAAGEETDHRADLYAIGALLYEMLAGAPAFSGTLHQIVMDKVARDAPSLALRCPAASPELVRLVARCLARDPAARPATAEALLKELQTVAEPRATSVGGRSWTTLAVGGAAIVAAAIFAALFIRDRRVRWVHEIALPEIARLADVDELDSAFALAELAAARAPDDSAVDAAWAQLSLTQTFLSEPPGAVVTRAAVDDTTRWIPVGTTPTPPVRIPRNAWFYRYSLPGYRTVTVMGARLGGSYVPIPSPIPLRRLSDPDSDMVLLRGSRLTGTLFGLAASDTVDLSDFLMDKLEVTNRQYKMFVDAGGYATRELWDTTIVRGGTVISWERAIAQFTDRTGRPGPASWEGSAPPDGAEDLPVGGVSWYEARAYARFVGKALPTVLEWNAAAIPEAARWVVPQGRYESTGPVTGGAARGVSPRGVYDMAGNVREWTVNARDPGSRYILGGGWSDPPYLFSEIYTQPEFDRSTINGIRLVRRLSDAGDLVRAAAPIPGLTRNLNTVRPVDDATFRGYLSMYDYDRTPLNATVVSRDSTSADWIREDIEFDVPGSNQRMWAALFLPRRVQAPYQTVVFWPASDAFILRDRRNLAVAYVDYIARSGRAVLYPIFEHTYGRGSPSAGDVVAATIEHRDQVLRWAKEMRRSIDYIATRSDIDTTRIGFLGTSWGARMAGVVLAIEPRLKTAVLNVAGISARELRAEEDPVNFLPRIRMPVLMLSGRYDSVFPFETSQKPFLRLLGSPPGDKQQILFDGGHFLPRTMMVAESLKWLDRYLGPIVRQ